MSKTLSADVIALAAKHGATVHANLAWNGPERCARFRVTCIADAPQALAPQFRQLLREGGFLDQRVTFPGPNRLQIDAR